MQGSGGPGGSSLLSSRFLGVLLFCGYVDIVAGGGVVSAVGVLALDCAADVAQVSVAVSVYCFFCAVTAGIIQMRTCASPTSAQMR